MCEVWRKQTWRMVFLALAAFSAAAGPARAQTDPNVGLKLVAGNLDSITNIVNAGDGSGRLFLTLQGGRIVIYNGTQILPTPLINLESLITSPRDNEQGLLGLAFHPNYASNRYFYVDYTDRNGIGNTVIARYQTRADDPNRADLASGTILLTVTQPFTNHNGGQLQFGADGYLYIGLGDGGSGGDPQGNGQKLNTLLGKILRIDVDHTTASPPLPYAIPPDNPFVSTANTRDEIWAYGVRNPWRFSFDRTTHDLLIGDVGQNSFEEIDVQPAASTGGENYGWNVMEGKHCYPDPGVTNCNDGTLTLPVLEYSHASGRCSVTGGYRYRGTQIPSLAGKYLYADFCTGEVWTATPDGGGVWSSGLLVNTPYLVSTFGQDEQGELYLAHRDGSGAFYKFVPSLAVSDVTMVEGNSGTSNAVFTVTVSPAPSGTLMVNFATADGTATAGSDYVARTGVLSFAAGTSSQTVAVQVLGDTAVENDETFTLTASYTAAAGLVSATGTATITNDDQGPGISANDVSVGESAPGAVFTVTLDATSVVEVSVNYGTVDGTAAAGADYVSTTGTLTFAPGTTSQTVGIPILDDVLDEADETFTLQLSSPANGFVARNGTATIQDDDPPPSVSVGNVTTLEGDTGFSNAAFTLSLSAPSTRTVSVNFATADGTATAGQDYQQLNGSVSFAPFTTTRTVLVRVLGDTSQESDETYHLLLSSPTNATLGDADGLGTILDDDTQPALSIGNVRIPEGNSGTTNAVFSVGLNHSSLSTVTVNWATANGSARAGEDYQPGVGQLSFAPGETSATFAVHVIGDHRRERNEVFLVKLSSAVNARIARGQGQGTIDNDDGPADGCTPIGAIPFTIDAPGRYCLAQDATVSLATGAAIQIEADDVRLDLQRHRLTQVDLSTQAYGVFANGRKNIRVENGTLDGFFGGVELVQTPPYTTPQGHVITHLTVANSRYAGVWLEGRGNTIADNQVKATGGTAFFGADSDTFGVVAIGPACRVLRNSVSGTHGVGTGHGVGVDVGSGDGTLVSRNQVNNNGAPAAAVGVRVEGSSDAVVNTNRLWHLDFGVVFEPGAAGTYKGNTPIAVSTPYVGGTPGP
jgi:glucose/arabinose dehydrogenase